MGWTMINTAKPLLELNARDLMSHELVQLSEDMSLRAAARLLLDHQISGAPVVDGRGRCVGALSATDFLRRAGKPEEMEWRAHPHASTPGPYQTAQYAGVGACHECKTTGQVLCEWQVMDLENLPTDEVRRYMTADPVTVAPATPIAVIARKMTDAHIHRVIVVDEAARAIGIVTSTDILAAVARAADL